MGNKKNIAASIFFISRYYIIKVVKKVISLDPGIARTGYAVMLKNDDKVTAIEYGCITTEATEKLENRLLQLYQQLEKVIKKHHPDIMILEKVFFNHNQTTMVAIGQAQGVMLLAASQANLSIEFVTPLQIKSALTGYGLADKRQVQRMVKTLLNLDQIPKPDDTADALACGLAYFSYHQFKSVLWSESSKAR